MSDEEDILFLEEPFYVAEYGFSFVVQTGLDLSNMIEGDLKGVFSRPDDSFSVKDIALTDVVSLTTGTVLFSVGAGDFSIAGRYVGQVFVKDTALGIARPSHPFAFNVKAPIGGKSTHPWM